MHAETQVVPPEEMNKALEVLWQAHELLLCMPCRISDEFSVRECRAKEKADCSMCQSALMNEGYFQRDEADSAASR